MQTVVLTQPDDWHTHLRDGACLARTVLDTEKYFARAVVMPNLSPPVVTVSQALAYRDRILQHVKKDFQPLMTLFLTEDMSPEIILEAKKTNAIIAGKYYPAHGTTHADQGIHDFRRLYPILDAMQSIDLVLCVHGESPGVDMADREKIFLHDLQKIISNFPKLRVVLEHISTEAAVEFILSASNNVAATITPHHLHYTRDDLFSQGHMQPHYFCMPILKTRADRDALIRAAISGNPKFFLGTDSAPHAKEKKESAHTCAGIYSAHAALELYAEIFETAQALDKLNYFASRFGAEFYALPMNTAKITLIKKPWQVPMHLSFGDASVVPMKAGESIAWQIQSA